MQEQIGEHLSTPDTLLPAFCCSLLSPHTVGKAAKRSEFWFENATKDNFTWRGRSLQDAVDQDWGWTGGGGLLERGPSRAGSTPCQGGCVGGRCTGRQEVIMEWLGGGTTSLVSGRWWCWGGTLPGQGGGRAGALSPSPSCTSQELQASRTLVSALVIP